MFKAVDNKINFPKMEEKILKFWEDNKIFEKSLEQTKGNEEYLFLDGPPFATGLPHYGHLIGGTLKDVVPRFWTMKGKYVVRRFGWDCHGLPVEVEVEKQMNFSGKEDIEKFGIDNFNETCRSIVLKFVNEWEQIVKRTGRWVDFENDYKTMNLDFMESVWWVFKNIWDKGLIKKGYRVNPFCTRCSTPLSKHEASQEYKDVQDPAITLLFKVEGEENLYLTAWTTTPWTLPSNAALAVHNEIEYTYLKVKEDPSKILVMGSARVAAYFKEEEIEILKKVKGTELVGLRYEPLFDFFAGSDPYLYQVIVADYVSTSDGTGIVHQAPAFGQEDYEASRAYKIPLLNPIDDLGKFTAPVTAYEGLYIKDADKKIIKDLKEAGKILKHSTVEHSYPFCYRCQTPLIQRATDSWVMDIEPIKQKIIANNKKINWVPSNIKEGRFGKLLEGMPEWHISRNRYWGAPLPIWICEECGHQECVGSIEELKARSNEESITDLHKHFVDKIKIKCEKCGKEATRTSEVLDCWFESGSMPYAQNHYPFENKEFVEKNLPADFIAEGIDQTRGWFNKLLVLSTALFDKPAYANVIVNGTVLAEDGSKMSKSKQNYPPVMDILNKYGADSMRMYLINSPAVHAENLRFSEVGVKEVIKKIMLPLWNSYSFLVMYANIDDWKPAAEFILPENLNNKLDKWIMSSLQTLIKEVNLQMQEYKLYNVLPAMVEFIDNLTNWYIRRSRRRFWKSENDGDKLEAYQTLYEVLSTLVKVLAPVMPFIAEEIYQNLELSVFDSKESVHLQSFPVEDESYINTELEEEMDFVQTVVKLGRTLRNEKNIKIRQPLKSITVVANREVTKKAIREMKDLILDELNIKEVLITEKEEDLVLISAKPNFKVIGKKFGKKVKAIAKGIANLDSKTIKEIEAGKIVTIEDEEISQADMSIIHERKEGVFSASEGDITVSLDIEITKELLFECHAREMINRIANMRKDLNFEVADRIKIKYYTDSEELQEAIDTQKGYIMTETLAEEFDLDKELKQENISAETINNMECLIKLINLS